MKYLKKFVYFGIIIFLFSCQTKQNETDVKIINQIFPQLTKAMHLSIVKAIDFPPPPPKFLSLDFSGKKNTYIKRSEIKGYISSLNKYRSYLQDCYSNYSQLDSINVVVGLSDTLYAYPDLEKEFTTKKISKEYSGVLQDLNSLRLANKLVDFKNITNTGIFKVESVSKLGWYPRIDMKFWKKKRDYYLTGVLLLSRIYLDKTKTHGIFYCTKVNYEKEPLSNLIFIKKTNNKWEIDKVELR
jgi:hypothetical protein